MTSALRISRSLYWDLQTRTGHASYGLSMLALKAAPTLNGRPVDAIDYSPLVGLVMVMDAAPGWWRPLTQQEMDDIDGRLAEMLTRGLSVWN